MNQQNDNTTQVSTPKSSTHQIQLSEEEKEAVKRMEARWRKHLEANKDIRKWMYQRKREKEREQE